MNMIPHFEIVSFDSTRDKVSIKINVLEDEYLNFIRSLPKRVYNHGNQTNEIPSSSLQEFYNRADEKEYRYSISDEVSQELDAYFKRADFRLTLDARRGRIVISPNRPNLKPLYQSGLTTWAMEYERYSVAISEAYNIPSIIPVYNPTVSFEYSPEVKEVLAREASRRANLFALSSATDAPEINDDISFALRPFQKVAKKFALHLDGRAILAAQLAGRVDLSEFHDDLATWLKRALSPEPAKRFADAETMRASWREVVRSVSRDERRANSGLSKIFKQLGAVFRDRPRTASRARGRIEG